MKNSPLSPHPTELRPRLEAARIRLLALFRALDQMTLSAQEIPQDLLAALFELDADFAEALWALDQPPGTLDLAAVVHDSCLSLDELDYSCNLFTDSLTQTARSELIRRQDSLLENIHPNEAYNQIPGRDPNIC